MEIKLNKDNRILYLNAIHVVKTYSGLLCGDTRKERINERIHKNNKRDCAQMWGKRKTFIFKPDLTKTLPSHVFYAWLTSDATDRLSCGSELVVMWYDNFDENKLLKENITPRIENIDWYAHAVNFDY